MGITKYSVTEGFCHPDMFHIVEIKKGGRGNTIRWLKVQAFRQTEVYIHLRKLRFKCELHHLSAV